MRLLRICASIFALTTSAFAQSIDLSEKSLIATLRSSESDVRAEELRSIGVPDEVAQRYKDLDASLSSQISWFRLRTSGSMKEAALFLPCQDESDIAYLFLVTYADSGWKVGDRYEADCHYRADVSVELVANIVPGRDSILLHQDCTGHGTEFAVHNLHAFNPARGKLREILNTEESMFWSGWDEKGGLRRSLFVPIASPGGTRIEQTQITQRLDEETGLPSSAGEGVKRRMWLWSAQKGHMTPTRFQKIAVARPASAP
jgi:hypothetical protein